MVVASGRRPSWVTPLAGSLCSRFQFAAEPILVRDMRGLHVFQGRQQAARVGARVAVAFELGDELALPRDVSLALGDMAVGRCQVAQNCAAIHGPEA